MLLMDDFPLWWLSLVSAGLLGSVIDDRKFWTVVDGCFDAFAASVSQLSVGVGQCLSVTGIVEYQLGIILTMSRLDLLSLECRFCIGVDRF